MDLSAFQRLQAKVDTKAHLNPRFFGEVCTFAPQDLPDRPVTGNVDVQTTEESGPGEELRTFDELSFHCSRDVDHERGGVNQIRVGDLLYRSPSIDPDQVPYTATGERRNESHLTWTLIFTRRTTKGRGFDE